MTISKPAANLSIGINIQWMKVSLLKIYVVCMRYFKGVFRYPVEICYRARAEYRFLKSYNKIFFFFSLPGIWTYHRERHQDREQINCRWRWITSWTYSSRPDREPNKCKVEINSKRLLNIVETSDDQSMEPRSWPFLVHTLDATTAVWSVLDESGTNYG